MVALKSIRLPMLILACSLIAVAAIGGLARTVGSGVDELLTRSADIGRHAPVDYGLGPGRGRPRAAPKQAAARFTSPKPGAIIGITLSSGGAYTAPTSCTIAPPTGTGRPANCSVYAYGMAAFPASAAGAGYQAGDVLTMTPEAGLNCAIYPAISVSSVDPNGGVTVTAPFNPGLCFAFPTTGTYAFSGGAGSGYASSAGDGGVRWSVLFATASGGSGYKAAPSVTFQSSTFGAAVGTANLADLTPVASTTPTGSATAAVQGFFGPAIPWPINPIHVVLLPDGRILDFGTDETGTQSGALLYDVWDPTLGTGMDAHLVLPNTTSTDIFCSDASVVWKTGKVLISGGDLIVDGVRNYANNKTTIFNPANDTVTQGRSMQFPRWYPSLVPLPGGAKLVLGGYLTRPATFDTPIDVAATPEVYDSTIGWRSLTNVSLPQEWYYPRAFVGPRGDVFILGTSGNMWSLTIRGAGTLRQYATTAPWGDAYEPTIMFAPGKILSLRGASAIAVDINGPKPLVSDAGTIDQQREDANATVLADGTVLVNGGSTDRNVLAEAAYTTLIWNPATGQWTTGVSAAKPRLYHSTSLLLPDGSVLTAGGGSPGPVINLNAEIYYPSYLYANDGSGTPAVRPTIANVMPQNGVAAGQALILTMGNAIPVSRVTLVRSGAATHATNGEQRFIDLTSSLHQSGPQISVTLPSNPDVVLPGYYMIFAFDQSGVPSVASQVLVTK